MDKDYAQDALDTLALQGVEGTAMAQVFATLAVAQELGTLERTLDDILTRIHNRLDGIEDLIAEGH